MSQHFAAALSTAVDWQAAVEEVCRRTLDSLGAGDAGRAVAGGAAANLGLLFVSGDRAAHCEEIVAQIRERTGVAHLLGCSGEAIAGTGREIEGEPALSLWLANLPGASLTAMHLRFERSPEGGAIVGWPGELSGDWPEQAAMLLLGDPYSFPADTLLERLNEDRPGVPVIGGMASSGAAPGENRLMLDDRVLHEGAVAVLLEGVRLRTVVSQGCRPIGRHFVVTKAEQNIIYELGGRPALLQLKEVFDTLPTHEQQMVQRGLHLGRVVSEYQDHFQQGDFLVRNVMGIDPDNGAIAVGDYFRVGQTVQFHIRDWKSADQELRELLAAVKTGSRPEAALLFTCNGRGTRLFPEPHHDAATVASVLGEVPLAGFFAAGELGPVGGKNFMHGFTASLALFEAGGEA